MEGPFYHFLITLPIFAVILIFLVMPFLEWINSRLFDRKFTLRFGGAWDAKNKDHRRDVVFSVIAFVVSLAISFLILKALILKGILPPLG